MLDLPLVFLVGVFGSEHCVGMCNGFVLAVSAQRSSMQLSLAQAAYRLGKTVSQADWARRQG